MQLAELFARHHQELYRYAARFTGDPDLAEDVVQDAFVRLAERPPADDSQLRGWLFRVATTIALDAMRSARRRLALVRERPDRQPMGDAPPDPAAALERAETRRRVREALAALGPKERAVLLMREEGFMHREIAAAVGTTTQSVGTMIARALEKLARHLDLDEEAGR
ncbi:MAG TPA: sigma-70 family RNA polymerase sigma factor [Gemmatimonadales bacterium]|nr:sigma-70 family RNA polymerase sigma factor [Gemmatimonadales bacterium]